jgi:hypothetical protein
LLDRQSGDAVAEGYFAKLLSKSGTRSVKGCLLAAEHVFSIYKKGKLRLERLTLKVEPELVDLWME